MIDYEYANRRYRDLTEKLIVPAFRNIALSYCVERSDIYEALELYDVLQDKDLYEYFAYEDLIKKYRLRLIRLIKRLNVEKTEEKTNNVFFEKKVYDGKLHENMVISYLPLAKMIDDSYWQTIDLDIWIRSLAIDEQEGFSIVEFALIVCLLISITGRSLEKINHPVATENELKRAKPRFRKIKEGLFSKELETILANLILNMLAQYYQKDYESTLNRYLTDFWLPESKRHLKTAHYAVKRYGKQWVKTYYSEEDLKKLTPEKTIQLLQGDEKIARMQWLFFVIAPITQAILDGVVPKDICDMVERGKSCTDDKESTNIDMREYLLRSDLVQPHVKEHIRNMPPSTYKAIAEDYLVACKLCDALVEYISEVRKAVVRLLETLPEAQIARKVGLWEYLSDL